MTLWDQPGVPHRGWRSVDVEDLGAGGPAYRPGTCQMCGKKRLRYMHTMEHDHHAGLEVGRICAEKMATDYDAAAAENKLRTRAGVRSRWLSRRWRTSTKGNPFLRIDGLVVGISPSFGGRRKHWITEQDSDGTYMASGRSYETPDEAKLALFDAYWQLKQGL